MNRAISFDVWNTLITPNRKFSAERTMFLSRELDIPAKNVADAYTLTKHFVDRSVCETGIGYSVQDTYELLCQNLNVPYRRERMTNIAEDVNRLFLRFTPDIHPSVINAVQVASRVKWLKIGIASNSNFISGNLMHPFLETRFGVKFDFAVYSDLCGRAKPSEEFFARVYSGAMVNHSSRILHVGDSRECDVVGATNSGFRAHQVSSHDDVVNAVMEFIYE